ncbi:MAG TPA: choice-of-anchor V domain-containing protein, partial [Myxococcaceae bacterium]|nr:choice-of-anchor V domain-containing protein [Myxococcaceae bacterium]
GTAAARSGGFNGECTGCHNGGQAPTLSLTSSPATFEPAQTVTLTVTVSNVNGGGGGFFLSARDSEGTFSNPGSGVRLLSTTAVTHSGTKAPSGGVISFSVQWTAPAQAGGSRFLVSGLSSNSSGGTGGDLGASQDFSLVYGCAGTTYYQDNDRDGYGSASLGVTRDCTKPDGYSINSDDCNDNDETAYPGATERCNTQDDDCDGEVNEGAPSVTLYPDEDEDGHGVPYGMTVQGCGQRFYAPNKNDCNDKDAAISPEAVEVCNGRDDNCNQRIDERVTPVCGLGMCARQASGCNIEFCTPGQSTPETCNGLDDDCDGEVDNGARCASGQACLEARCVEGNGLQGREGNAAAGGCTAAPIGGAVAAWALLSLLLRRKRS